MRRLATLIAAAATALALGATATPVVAAAPVIAGTATHAKSERSKPKKLKLKTSPRDYSHFGQQGVKVTAMVGNKRAKGKVTFKVNGATVAKQKVKKGKADYQMPADTAPGTYKIKAKYKKLTGKTKVTVFNSSLTLSEVNFTVSQATDEFDQPELTGTVIFKGKSASAGFVDIYQDGKFEGGYESPQFCCMATVLEDGSFGFRGYRFLGEVAKNPVGTYQYKAFYTPTSSYSEYIYSTWITVTVVP